MIKKLPPALIATSSILFLFFFRPEFAFHLQGKFDEHCYIDWLRFFMGLPRHSCFSDDLLPGAVTSWLPFGFIIRIIGLFNSAFNFEAWLPVCASLGSFFAVLGAFFLLYSILKKRTQGTAGPLLTILLFFNIPILYYATFNTHLSHPSELCTAFLFIWLIINEKSLFAVLMAILLTVTRWNDVGVFFLLFGYFLDKRKSLPLKKNELFGLVVFSGAFLALTVWKLYFLGFVKGYNSVSIPFLLMKVEWTNPIRVLFSEDSGLIWFNFMWLCIFASGVWFFDRLSWASRGAVLWMGSNLLLIFLWRGNGNYFGYRYLLGTYAAAFFVLTELIPTFKLSVLKLPLFLLTLSALWIGFLSYLYPVAWPWPISDRNLIFGLPLIDLLRNFDTAKFRELIYSGNLLVVLRSWFGTLEFFSTQLLVLVTAIDLLAIAALIDSSIRLLERAPASLVED